MTKLDNPDEYMRCQLCNHLKIMHLSSGCTATFPKPCKCREDFKGGKYPNIAMEDIEGL